MQRMGGVGAVTQVAAALYMWEEDGAMIYNRSNVNPWQMGKEGRYRTCTRTY